MSLGGTSEPVIAFIKQTVIPSHDKELIEKIKALPVEMVIDKDFKPKDGYRIAIGHVSLPDVLKLIGGTK